ncbi:NB-ARC domain-containing protein [Murinocardiopsis flavida]|uniref:NB-ARC domain-containing protein n=1 Tax=Murinocardiopsis flavida TaxID=645275 RepID=A0A2P8DEV1_9ACTN|nr:tetratricopeptide repeat protein [Murinocardiopsis flavida]PSK95728.1 NB-ARC domain-containing protein [Murinocardiopsis flavida]
MGETTPMADNEITDASGAVVQAGAVHGDVHISASGRQTQTTPHQLPLNVNGFVNRRGDLATLDALVVAAASHQPPGWTAPMVVSTIAGAPGIGKTALAVHWAHRVRSDFSDGDLYVDMRGYGPGPRVEAVQALDTLLRALDVTPDRIPVDLDGRAALFRSLLSGKRVLVLIDNAASADQVRPLLPGSPESLVLVTSRSTLPGLVAREGASRMVLDILTPDESLTLLRQIVGAERVDSEPAAARRLAQLCVHLPLALRITAERVNSRPRAALSDFVAELSDEKERLDALGFEDDELSDVRAAFAASYNNLDPDAARLFRLTGLHPGNEFGVHACAAMADISTSAARRLLDRLARVHLVSETGTDRYRSHDLLRLYAAERAAEDETPTERTTVLRRMLDWYLRSVYNGHRVILPAFRELPLPPPEGSADPPAFDSVDDAMRWFETERSNLVDAVRIGTAGGLHDLGWRLPAVMYGFFELRGYWSQWRDIHLLGLEAADAADDDHGRACNHLGLGDANWFLQRIPEAFDCYRRAVDEGRRAGDGWVEGFALRQIGVLLQEQERFAEAIERVEEARAVFESTDERRGNGMALLTLGDCHRGLGHTGEAVRYCEEAVALFQRIGDTWSVAWGRCALGRALAGPGRWAESLSAYEEAFATFRAFGDRRNELRALVGMGEACTAAGWTDDARRHLGAAMEIAEELGDDEVADLAARIEALSAEAE